MRHPTEGAHVATDITIPVLPVPPLRDGDRMTRAEFERRWDATPHVKKAELIDGVVYMPPALSIDHGAPHFDLIGCMAMYRLLTPGVQGADNASIRFDDKNMPQPDILLRLDEAYGGRSRIDADRYIEGGPELVAEIARSSASIDLGVKKESYRRHDVQEYIVWRVDNRAVDWFALRDGLYVPNLSGPDGVLRSEIFPGLWLDPAALVAGDTARLLIVAQQGHGSPEHTEFVRQLRQRAGVP
jgi:hypothetical protein